VLALLAYPLGMAVYYSLTSYELANPAGTRFVGLDNYAFLLQQFSTAETVLITLAFVGLVLGAELPLGLGIALLLDRDGRVFGILRTIVLMPMMIPLVVAALVWRTMMAPIEGVLNYAFQLVGLPALAWLGDPTTALPSVVLIDVWTHVPFVALILLAALQGLPRESYQAAMLDGASPWQLFRYFTLPLVSPFLALVAIFRTIDAFKAFDIIFASTDGGPGRATTTLQVAAYQEGFTYGYMGTAMAYVLLLTALISAATLVLAALWRRSSRLKES